MVTRSVTRSVTQPVAIPFALAGRSMLRLPYRGASLSLAFDSQQYAMGAIGKRPAAFAFSDLITFTRASGGGRFNASGQYEWLPANQPRIDFDPVTGECRGLLIEEQRTNLLTYSSDFASAAWAKSGVIVPSDRFAAPDGYASATKLVETTANTNHFLNRVVTITAGSAYSFSVFAKAGERTHAIISFGKASSPYTRIRALVNLVTGEVTSAHVRNPVSATISANPIGGGVYRIAVSGVIDATTTDGYVDVRIYNGAEAYQGDGTSGIYIWGAQLEQGAFPTSYIPTTDAQVTRASDIASVNKLSPWYNPEQGTLFVEAVAYGATGLIAAFSDGTANNRIEQYFNSGKVTSLMITNGDYMLTGACDVVTTAQSAKVATAFSSAGLASSVNGSAVVTDDTVPTIPALTRAYIGADSVGVRQLNGHIRVLRFYPKRLSDSQLQELTA